MSPMMAAVVSTELKLHRRHGVFAGTAAMAFLWGLLLLLLPAGLRPSALPWVLFLEVAALGFFFVPALAVLERANGVTAALRLTGLPPALHLGVRLGMLVIAALAVSLPLMAISGGLRAAVAGGVILTTLLFSLVALVMVGRAGNLTTFLARVPLVAIPLLAPALAHAAGVSDSRILLLSPATAGWELLAGRATAFGAGWMLVWIAVLGAVALRVGFEVRPAGSLPGRLRGHPAIRRRTGPARGGALRSLAAVDLRTLMGDRILLLLLGGIPLIALALRWVTGPGVAWIEARYGFDLAPHVPAVQAFVLVAHFPVIFGALTALLFLEDRDAGLMPALAVTPAGVASLVAYRLAATVGVTGFAVAGGMGLAGANHPAGWVGVLAVAAAGGCVATVPVVVLASLAKDRVQGMALMKVITLPFYLPVAWWFVDGPAGRLFGLIPTGLAAKALWTADPLGAVGFAAGCVLLSAALVTAFLPRLLRDY